MDLYQIHRFDDDAPIEETLEALNDVVRAGKALYIGASSMYAWQFAKMLHIQRARGWAQFVSMQNHYNLIYREEEREMIPLCRAEGIGLIPWSPLARGFLAGNRKRETKDATLRETHDHYGHSLYYAPEDYDIADRVVELAGRKGVLPIQIALAWVASQPGVTAPIVGVTQDGAVRPADRRAVDRARRRRAKVPGGGLRAAQGVGALVAIRSLFAIRDSRFPAPGSRPPVRLSRPISFTPPFVGRSERPI